MLEKLGIGLMLSILFCSCAGTELKTMSEARKYLESHNFHDDHASISGKTSKGSITSPFEISFEKGDAIIGDEKMSYSITSISDGRPKFNGSGFIIELCGSQRYAYGGCLKGYLSSGMDENDKDISLQIEGEHLSAFFSERSKSITKK